MGGDEGTILKHNVKDRDKNHLTNKKPILDIMSQDRIPILWIETKQAEILDLLREPDFKCIKSSQKLGKVTAVYRQRHWCTKQTTQCLEVNLKSSRQNNQIRSQGLQS